MPSNAFDRLDAKSNDVEKRRLAEIGDREKQKLCITYKGDASLLSDMGNVELICKVCTFY